MKNLFNTKLSINSIRSTSDITHFSYRNYLIRLLTSFTNEEERQFLREKLTKMLTSYIINRSVSKERITFVVNKREDLLKKKIASRIERSEVSDLLNNKQVRELIKSSYLNRERENTQCSKDNNGKSVKFLNSKPDDDLIKKQNNEFVAIINDFINYIMNEDSNIYSKVNSTDEPPIVKIITEKRIDNITKPEVKITNNSNKTITNSENLTNTKKKLNDNQSRVKLNIIKEEIPMSENLRFKDRIKLQDQSGKAVPKILKNGIIREEISSSAKNSKILNYRERMKNSLELQSCRNKDDSSSRFNFRRLKQRESTHQTNSCNIFDFKNISLKKEKPKIKGVIAPFMRFSLQNYENTYIEKSPQHSDTSSVGKVKRKLNSFSTTKTKPSSLYKKLHKNYNLNGCHFMSSEDVSSIRNFNSVDKARNNLIRSIDDLTDAPYLATTSTRLNSFCNSISRNGGSVELRKQHPNNVNSLFRYSNNEFDC